MLTSTLAQFFAALAVILFVFLLMALLEKYLQSVLDEPAPVCLDLDPGAETRDDFYNEAP